MKTLNKSILTLALFGASALGTANASIIQIGDGATANQCNIAIGDFSQNLLENDDIGGTNCANAGTVVGPFSTIQQGAWGSAAFGTFNKIGIGSIAATALGSYNTISDGVEHATAVGNGNRIEANHGFAAGWVVTIGAAAVDGIGIGTFANVQAVDGIAIGHNSRVNAGHDRSLALGSQTQTSKANEAAFGFRQLSQVEDGVDPTDAVNVRQMLPMARAFGGGANFDNGTFVAPNYTFMSGAAYDNVGDALADLDRRLTTVEQAPPGTGPAGPAGPQGPAGPAGPQGPAGQDGADGQDGVDGAPGPAGPQGPAGEGGSGTAGPAGPQGPAGQDGADGRDGVDGAPGRDGVDGQDGATGPQGPAGQDGRDGRDGLAEEVPACTTAGVCYDDESKASVSLGGTNATVPVKVNNVANGRIEENSKDAVNGGQIWALEQDWNDRWTHITKRMDGFDKRIDQVGAQAASMAMMAGASTYLPVGKIAISAGYGQYGSGKAFAVGAKARLTERASASIGLSATGGSEGKLMIGAGFSYILP